MDRNAASRAGLIATVPMTAALYATRLVGRPTIDMLRILGRFAARDDRVVLPLGSAAHLAAGAAFATLYSRAWASGVAAVSGRSGALFGAVHGVLASISIAGLLAVHPRRPHLPEPPRFVPYLIAHLVYGMAVGVAYAALRGPSPEHFASPASREAVPRG